MALLRETYPMIVGGRAVEPNRALEVMDKHAGTVACRVPMGGAEEVEQAIASAADARREMAAAPAHARRSALRACAREFHDRREELEHILRVEAGKPVAAARAEVVRLVETFDLAADEAGAIGGEVLSMDASARGVGYAGMTRRVPVGPCGLITPFNFPLNLVAHKVAPAIAAGCPFVLKPADRTPVGALVIGSVVAGALSGAGLPAGACSVLVCSVEHAAPIVEDERLRLFSFTGSDSVGRELAHKAGMKRVVLELGGNAACVVDDTLAGDADALADAADRIVAGGYAQSGQSCISVQRVLAHEDVIDDLRALLVERVGALRAGDPSDEAVTIGPMIDTAAAERVEAWIDQAVEAGARLLVGGPREGAIVPAALLEGVPHGARLWREEAFGPVVVLERFGDFGRAMELVNDSRYGLQAGVFTRDVARVLDAWDGLEVGGVIVNDAPSFRLDHTPYGGVKRSGLGREGVRSAVLDMTEERLLVIRR